MNDFKQTSLFSMLAESSKIVTNEEIQNAYENFVTEIERIDQSDRDCMATYRILGLTRIEFQSLQAQNLYEQGEKCPKKYILTKGYLVS